MNNDFSLALNIFREKYNNTNILTARKQIVIKNGRIFVCEREKN